MTSPAPPAPDAGRPASAARASLMARPLLVLIRGYQRFISPMLGAHCRYLPSCSEYAVIAIMEWGALRGSLLAAWRILRCNPFVKGGLDLPPSRSDKSGGTVGGHDAAPPGGGSAFVTDRFDVPTSQYTKITPSSCYPTRFDHGCSG